MITTQSINAVKVAVRIEEVIGDCITLKRRGASLLGCCPFHNEKTPSFTVSPLKGIYKCFGCGVSGDAIGFLMEYDGEEYLDVIRKLAARYNVHLEETVSTEDYLEKNRKEDGLYILNNAAADYFWKREGKYFQERGLTNESRDKFLCGYSGTGYRDLYDHLRGLGFAEEAILEAGLCLKNDKGVIDLFRSRAMFPIHNLAGKIAGFGGRDLTGDKTLPKYVNTGETPIYSKGKMLYGMYYAKKAIRMQNEAILVEGYTDKITLAQNGIDNVVTSSGTALSVDQVRLIKRHTSNIVVLFDGDKAGINAAIKSLEVLLDEKMNIQVMVLPDGHDPDSFIKAQGVELFLQWKKNHSMSVVEFICSLDISRNEKFEMLNGLIGRMTDIQQWAAGKEAATRLEVPEHLFGLRVTMYGATKDKAPTYESVLEQLRRALTLHEGFLQVALIEAPTEEGVMGLTIGEMVKATLEYVGGKFITTPAVIGAMQKDNIVDNILNHDLLFHYQILVLDYHYIKLIMAQGTKTDSLWKIVTKKETLLKNHNK